ncbi:MAG: imidazole glycerol phosphate synthase subunit HisH [Candidatus Omnitrophica bacterium]|nr:imidazole glycerol phosphate synthase subunit HisH [Candidatus Omnitrophota bacterium]
MIVIIDCGMGNLHSVQNAVLHLGGQAEITDSAERILGAESVIFPGQAHFGKAVKELHRRGLFSCVKEKISQKVPFLGICMGMQLLMEESEEAPGQKALGVIPGRVKRFARGVLVPHIGWNQLKLINRPHGLFQGVKQGTHFYFAHSYYCVPADDGFVAGVTAYGAEFASSVKKDNVWGVQFHPEKSQDAGLRILKNFLAFTKAEGGR